MLVDGFAPRACGIYEVWVPLLLCYVFFSACSTMLWPRTRATRRAWKSSEWRETDHDSQSPQARMSNFIWVTYALVLASFSLHGQCRRRSLFWFQRLSINWNCLNNWCLVLPINWNCPDKWSRRLSINWNCPENWFDRLSINWNCLNNWCRVLSINWTCPDKWSRRLSIKWNCDENCLHRQSVDWSCLNSWFRVMYRTWLKVVGTTVGATSFGDRPLIRIIRTIEFQRALLFANRQPLLL